MKQQRMKKRLQPRVFFRKSSFFCYILVLPAFSILQLYLIDLQGTFIIKLHVTTSKVLTVTWCVYYVFLCYTKEIKSPSLNVVWMLDNYQFKRPPNYIFLYLSTLRVIWNWGTLAFILFTVFLWWGMSRNSVISLQWMIPLYSAII